MRPFRNSDSMFVELLEKKSVQSYLTRDGPVALQDTLGVDVTRVGQAVAAAELWLAALHLISRETGLAAAAVVGALCGEEYIWFLLTIVNTQQT